VFQNGSHYCGGLYTKLACTWTNIRRAWKTCKYGWYRQSIEGNIKMNVTEKAELA